MIVILPVPPSVNGLYANVPGVGRVKTVRYRQWLKLADSFLMAQKIRKAEGCIELRIMLPQSTRGDVSNRIKAVEDYLVSRQITPDDKHNWKVSAERADVEDCHVQVTAA